MKSIKIIIALIWITASLNANQNEMDVSINDMKMEQFIGLLSKVIDKNIITIEEMQGKVEFYSTESITEASFPEVVKKVLIKNNLTIINRGDYYELVASNNKKSINPTTVKNIEEVKEDYVVISYAVQLERIKVEILNNKIFPLLSGIGRTITLQENNKIIIIDYKSKVKEILEIINQIEKGRDIETEYIPLDNVNINDVFGKIYDYSDYITSEVIISSANLTKNASDNAIVISGERKYIKAMKIFINKIDKNNGKESGEIKIYTLQNAEAKELMKILQEIVIPANKNAQKKGREKAEDDIHFTVETEMNAIIAFAPARAQKRIAGIIKKLDLPRKQVYVKTSIIEIEEDNLKDLGVKYGVEGLKATDMGIMSIASALTGASTVNSLVSSYQSTMSMSGVEQLFLLGVNLDLLQKEGVAEIISEPSILCVNNKESTIYVGQTESILTSSSNPTTGGVVKNFAREDIGLSLNIKPRILHGKNVNLDVKTIMEGIIRQSESEIGVPTTTKREVHTHVIVKSGEPIIIGGLTKTENVKNKSKIPLLGDIPWIGSWLFSSESVIKKKTNLVVILTPYIIDSTSEMNILKEEMEKIKQKQRQFNEDYYEILEKKK